MLNLSTFVRTFYAPSFLIGVLSHRTVYEYLRSLQHYIDVVGDLKLTELVPANHVRFLNEMIRAGSSNATIQKHCRHLNAIFSKIGPAAPRNRDAFGFLQQSPWIRPPQKLRKLPKEVRDDPVHALFHAVSSCPEAHDLPRYLDADLRPIFWKCVIQFVSSTALRRKAVFNLTWADIEPGQKFLVVPPHIDKARSERRKPLHPEVLRLLQAIRSADSAKLFPWAHGDKKFYSVWHSINRVAGLNPELTLHDLKRYALQHALRSGVDPATLQMLGDHSNIRTTLNHYVRENFERYVQDLVLPGSEKGGEQ